MTYGEYNDIRTDISIEAKCGRFIQYLNDITDIYPNLKNTTLEDAKQYLLERKDKFNRGILEKMGVFENENERTVEYDGLWNVTVKCDNRDKTVLTFKRYEL